MCSSTFNNFPVLSWFRTMEPVGKCALALEVAIWVTTNNSCCWNANNDKSFGTAICQFNGLSSLVLIKQQLLCMISGKIMFCLQVGLFSVVPNLLGTAAASLFQHSASALSASSDQNLPAVEQTNPFGAWMSSNPWVKCKLSPALVAGVFPWVGRAPSMGCSSRCGSSQNVEAVGSSTSLPNSRRDPETDW